MQALTRQYNAFGWRGNEALTVEGQTFDVLAPHVPAVCHCANNVQRAVHMALLSMSDLKLRTATEEICNKTTGD
jgi:hypothetical protein